MMLFASANMYMRSLARLSNHFVDVVVVFHFRCCVCSPGSMHIVWSVGRGMPSADVLGNSLQAESQIVCQFVCLFVCLFDCLFVCLFVCLF